jgi:IS66 Orf2 like protein
MIPVAVNVRIWIATGHTDMRKGMHGLALLVQEGLGRDPFAGGVYVFRGRGGSLIKAMARWNWIVALRQAAGSRTVRLAGDGRWCGGADCGADELSAGGDRLAQPATYVAAAERGIGFKNVLNGRKKLPQIAGFMIPSAS